MNIVPVALLFIFLSVIEHGNSRQLVDYCYLAKCRVFYPSGRHNNEPRFNIDEIYNSRPEGLFMNLTIYVLTWKNFAIQFFPHEFDRVDHYEFVLSEERVLSKIHLTRPDFTYDILTYVDHENIFTGLDYTPVNIQVQTNGYTEVFVNHEVTPLISYTLQNLENIKYVTFMSYWNAYSKVLFDCESAPPPECKCSTSCASSGMCSCKKDDIINELAEICKILTE